MIADTVTSDINDVMEAIRRGLDKVSISDGREVSIETYKGDEKPHLVVAYLNLIPNALLQGPIYDLLYEDANFIIATEEKQIICKIP